jgi:hypothetical protein
MVKKESLDEQHERRRTLEVKKKSALPVFVFYLE